MVDADAALAEASGTEAAEGRPSVNLLRSGPENDEPVEPELMEEPGVKAGARA